MKDTKNAAGHIAAAVTIFIWGTTFISTKVLLNAFTPLEILFFRFFIGYVALWIAAPRILRLDDSKGPLTSAQRTDRKVPLTSVRRTDRKVPLTSVRRTVWKKELLFAAAGLCGVTLYFLMENFALTLTLAANVSIIIAVAPFFTAIFDWLFMKGAKPGVKFLTGFTAAIVGIALLSFQGESGVHLSPKGDFLALAAAITWAAYSILTKKIGALGYGTIESTRRTFFYGLLFMVPVLFFLPFRLDFARFAELPNLFNILFLGFGASALCFVTWNFAVRRLGSVKTSVYIYAVPVITVVTSFLVLHEPISWRSICGIVLTLTGLMISEGRLEMRPSKKSGKNGGNEKWNLQN